MKNSLDPFSWYFLQITVENGKFLYITGKLNVCLDEVFAEIRKNELVTCDEPFNLIFKADSKLYGIEYIDRMHPAKSS
jgi:hypothetical protein